MRKSFFTALLILFSAIIWPLNDYAADQASEKIKLYLNEAKLLPVSNPTRIVIGNPAIVDVTQATKKELTITPKGPGTTTLVVWDSFGEQSYKIIVLTENTEELKSRIDSLLRTVKAPGVYTQIADEEEKIFLMGTVKTPEERERITVALGTLKDRVVDLIEVKEEETLVDIDVQVLELNKDASSTLGFSWPGSVTLTEKGSPGISVAGTKWSNLFKVLNLNRAAFSWTLDALIEQGKARILSRPRLACQSGKEAELLVGGEKPIFTTEVGSSGGEGTNVEYKEYGIKLKIKPIVNEKKQIKLALKIEVSEVGTAEFIGQSTDRTAQAYPLTKRNIFTELFLEDKQTLAIGGLIKHKSEEDIKKTAGLGDIPVLGALFRKKTSKSGGGVGERGDTELFITLTPTIISNLGSSAQKQKEEAMVTSVPSDSDKNVPAALTGYAVVIQNRILDNLVYPTTAKEAGFGGIVKLSLLLSYKGELMDVKVKSSSGYKILDDSAVYTAKGIISYPPFPASLDLKELWVDIPIAYQLE